jgi:hypothetical protein
LAPGWPDDRGVFVAWSVPLSLSQKAENPTLRTPTQVAAHLVPNQVLGFFEFFRERERGEVFCFQRLAKAFIGADSRKLKMCRAPPTAHQNLGGLTAKL